jgi:hypothetical protein
MLPQYINMYKRIMLKKISHNNLTLLEQSFLELIQKHYINNVNNEDQDLLAIQKLCDYLLDSIYEDENNIKE